MPLLATTTCFSRPYVLVAWNRLQECLISNAPEGQGGLALALRSAARPGGPIPEFSRSHFTSHDAANGAGFVTLTRYHGVVWARTRHHRNSCGAGSGGGLRREPEHPPLSGHANPESLKGKPFGQGSRSGWAAGVESAVRCRRPRERRSLRATLWPRRSGCTMSRLVWRSGSRLRR